MCTRIDVSDVAMTRKVLNSFSKSFPDFQYHCFLSGCRYPNGMIIEFHERYFEVVSSLLKLYNIVYKL